MGADWQHWKALFEDVHSRHTDLTAEATPLPSAPLVFFFYSARGKDGQQVKACVGSFLLLKIVDFEDYFVIFF